MRKVSMCEKGEMLRALQASRASQAQLVLVKLVQLVSGAGALPALPTALPLKCREASDVRSIADSSEISPFDTFIAPKTDL